MKPFAGIIVFLFISISAKAESNISNLQEMTIALVSDFSWVQTQVYKKINQPNPVPAPSHTTKITSKKEIISAYDTIKQQKLTVSQSGDYYEVSIPEFSMVSVIKLYYRDFPRKQTHQISPSWIEKPRLHGYVAASAGTYYNQKKWGDAFTHVEAKMKEMGFSTYARQTKASHHPHSTLWNSLAVKNKDGKSPFASTPDLVKQMGRRAKQYGLNLIAYYKDTGDDEIAKLYPEWVCKTPEGKKSEEKFLFLDLAGPFKEVALKQIIELSNRGAKGVYLDFRHFPAWGCFGSETERLFTLETGLEAPKRYKGQHWQWHPNWTKFLEFQSRKIAKTFAYWKTELKKHDPDFQFIISTAYLSGLTAPFHGSEMAGAADIVKVEFDHGLKKGLRRRVFAKYSTLAKPSNHILMTMAFTLGRDLSVGKMFHSWAYGFPNKEHLQGFVSAVIATGGIAAIHVDDQYLRSDFNPKNYKSIYKSATPYSAYKPAIELGKKISSALEGKTPKKWAAVLFSEQLRNTYQNDIEAAWRNILWPTVGAYESLLELGVPVSLLSDTTLSKNINNYKFLFIPVPESKLNKQTQTVIKLFKKQGGIVVSNNPARWKWDHPKFSQQAKKDFKKEIQSHIQQAPFRVIQNQTSLQNKPVYVFFYH